MPVLYALSILLIVTSVYAILACQLYGEAVPEQFSRFSLALFTVRTTALCIISVLHRILFVSGSIFVQPSPLALFTVRAP